MFSGVSKKWQSIKNLQHSPKLQWLGKRLHDPYLWHWYRTPVARGLGLGLFVLFIPLPFVQAILAIALAFFFRANLPITVAITWLNNPFTFVPINFFIYQLGSWIMGKQIIIPKITPFHWQLNQIPLLWHESLALLNALGKTYLIGLPIVAIGSGILGYYLVDGIWKLVSLWRKKV